MLKYLQLVLQSVFLYLLINSVNTQIRVAGQFGEPSDYDFDLDFKNKDTPIKCSGRKLDLVLLLDWDLLQHVTKTRYFIQDILMYADVDGGKVCVGLAFFSNHIENIFHLKDGYKKKDIVGAVPLNPPQLARLMMDSTGTDISEALKHLRNNMFTQENGDRQGVQNVAFVIYHSDSNIQSDRTIPEAEKTKAEGIHIYAIGFNTSIEKKELEAIASPPASRNSFRFQNYQTLSVLGRIIIVSLYTKCDLNNANLPCDFSCVTECSVSCPLQGFEKVADTCNLTESGPVRNTECVSSELSNLVNDIKNVSNEDFTRAINEVSNVILKFFNTTSSPDDVNDQIIRTLLIIGEKVSNQNFKVDGATFDKLVSLTDIVTSSKQRILQDVHGEGPAIISGLTSSLEKIAFKSFSDNELAENIHLIKNTLGVEIGLVHEDILYPNEINSNLPEHWINTSDIFLSQIAFDGINSSVKYSAMIIRNTDKEGSNSQMLIRNNDMVKGHKGQAIVSDILTLSVNVTLTTPLHSWVRLRFAVPRSHYRDPVCVFLKTSTRGNESWSNEGCKIVNITNGYIICTCNHLTTFAVLASPFQQLHHHVLSSLTTSGCAVSIICLTVTVIVYLYLWKYIKSERAVMLVDLSLCMMISYLIFVVGIDKIENKIICKVIAIGLHYCFLTVFCNFLSQSMALYISLHSMTDTPHRKVYLLLTHVCPLIIVSITLAVYKTEGYGTEKYCWLSLERGFIWSFLGPIMAIICVNGLVLIAVIRIAQGTRAIQRQDSTVKILSAVKAIVILTPLFGLTWIFGFLAINNDYVVFQYLFVILNSFQGLFIFIIYLLANRQVREAVKNLRKRKQSSQLDSANKTNSTSK